MKKMKKMKSNKFSPEKKYVITKTVSSGGIAYISIDEVDDATHLKTGLTELINAFKVDDVDFNIQISLYEGGGYGFIVPDRTPESNNEFHNTFFTQKSGGCVGRMVYIDVDGLTLEKLTIEYVKFLIFMLNTKFFQAYKLNLKGLPF